MINYENIHNSILHWNKIGYKRIESPWTVTQPILNITKPFFKDENDYYIPSKKKSLVASGEQSFLYLYLKGFLPKGKFQTVTPCFREEVFDQTHTKYFIKNELINTVGINESSLFLMIDNAQAFFEIILGYKPTIRKTEEGFDLYAKNIEIGSYGIRSCEYLEWIYGTACAEPRLSYVQNMK